MPLTLSSFLDNLHVSERELAEMLKGRSLSSVDIKLNPRYADMGTLTCNNTLLFTNYKEPPPGTAFIISHIVALRSAAHANEYYFYEINKGVHTVWGYSLVNNATTLRNYCYNSDTGGGDPLIIVPGERIRAAFHSSAVGGTAKFTIRYYEVKI